MVLIINCTCRMDKSGQGTLVDAHAIKLTSIYYLLLIEAYAALVGIIHSGIKKNSHNFQYNFFLDSEQGLYILLCTFISVSYI